jgi:hypothetical protein
MHKTCIGTPSMDDRIEGWPITTGELARRVGVPEAHLADAVRRGRLDPPPVRSGRRLWWPRHARAVAAYFGKASALVEAATHVADESKEVGHG